MDPKQLRPPTEDPLSLLTRGLTKLYSFWLSHFYPFASMGHKASFHFRCKVSRSRAHRISIGDSVNLREFAWLNVATEDPTGEPIIVIDDNCNILFGSIISARNRVHLERDVLVAQDVLIMDHNHEYEDISRPIVDQGITKGGTIRIGHGTWIGHGAVILCARGDLRIGNNCVIAASSVVTQSIPNYSVAAGNPARIVKYYDLQTKTWQRPQGRKTRSETLESKPGTPTESEPKPRKREVQAPCVDAKEAIVRQEAS